MVNTCGFVEAAKKDSIDTAARPPPARRRPTKAVVAVGCLAERYGAELAEALPEADAVLGFDDYAGDRRPAATTCSPAARTPPHAPARPAHAAAARASRAVQPRRRACRSRGRRPARRHGPASARGAAPAGWTTGRSRRSSSPPGATGAARSAPSRPSAARSSPGRPTRCWPRRAGSPSRASASWCWSARTPPPTARTSATCGCWRQLLPELAAVDGHRPGPGVLPAAGRDPARRWSRSLAGTPGVAPYFDLSFQHASAPVLRRMRRFGDTDRSSALLDQVRALAPAAGIRSNVIVGFPGETEAGRRRAERFLTAARLDAIGVFGYSDEDGTEAAGFDGKLRAGRDRPRGCARMSRAGRRADGPARRGAAGRDRRGAGRGGHRRRRARAGPRTRRPRSTARRCSPARRSDVRVGDLVRAEVTGTAGVDLAAAPGGRRDRRPGGRRRASAR